MKYVRLGSAGVEISRLGLGGYGFGERGRGDPGWSVGEREARDVIRRAIELGVTFFDTANVYSDGSSEEILGRALDEYARRDEIVIATKVSGRMRKGPNGAGLSRKSIMHEIDASLRRLGTDYVDLYQIHRWDPNTPIEETLDALHDVVKAGKARYVGASSMFAWQFATALHVAERRGWTRFVSMQDHYNLLYREEEREMHPLCASAGIGVLPWSPLARGLLARSDRTSTPRAIGDDIARTDYPLADPDRAIISAVARIASRRGVPRATVALSWVLSKPAITAPIVGATKLEHLDDAIRALDLDLSADEVAALEAPYLARAVVGHS